VIFDSSAVMAVVLHEPEAERFSLAMLSAKAPRMSAANWLEAAIVVDSNRDPVLRERFDELSRALRVEIVPVTVEIAAAARRAHQRYGRGRHPARLNYGDCFAYATAQVLGEPLLFKGDDFPQTDIAPALPAQKD
jgi:ribonuclease VapC